MNLASLGWSVQFENDSINYGHLARIIAIHKSHLRAITEKGEINIHLTRALTSVPAVGDWVETTPRFVDEQNEPAALIKNILERKSKISRLSAGTKAEEQIMAANIDHVFVVTSANLDLNINRLQRYLLLIESGGAKPIVVLSKADLNDKYKELADDLSVKLGKHIPIFPTSLVSLVGLDEVRLLMPEGSTSVFVGSSGVGKSSLVNYLLGEEVQSIKAIREDDGKGKHTTTSRELFFVPQGGMIIDTPGIREVQVFGDVESLSDVFTKINELSSLCKFSDCGHNNEPGCAIQKALSKDELSAEEWSNYQKLQREMAYANRRMNKVEQSNTKKRWKKVNVNYKAKKKLKGRN